MTKDDPKYAEFMATINAEPATALFRKEMASILSNPNLDIETCRKQMQNVRDTINDKLRYGIIALPVLKAHNGRVRELLGLPFDK